MVCICGHCTVLINAEDNKRKVREAGGIALLIPALRSSDEKIIRDAMRALRNLAFDGMFAEVIHRC